jgi:hypothetical protein
MKRPIILLGLAVLFGLIIAGTFLGCSGKRLSGVYELSTMAGNSTMEFKSGSKVIVTSSGTGREMKYTIKDDTLTITTPEGVMITYTIKDENTLLTEHGNAFRKTTR